MNYEPDYNDDARDECAEEMWLERRRKRYHQQLMAHPHPQDPDHPEPLEGDE